jgi:hypothetical protein
MGASISIDFCLQRDFRGSLNRLNIVLAGSDDNSARLGASKHGRCVHRLGNHHSGFVLWFIADVLTTRSSNAFGDLLP